MGNRHVKGVKDHHGSNTAMKLPLNAKTKGKTSKLHKLRKILTPFSSQRITNNSKLGGYENNTFDAAVNGKFWSVDEDKYATCLDNDDPGTSNKILHSQTTLVEVNRMTVSSEDCDKDDDVIPDCHYKRNSTVIDEATLLFIHNLLHDIKACRYLDDGHVNDDDTHVNDKQVELPSLLSNYQVNYSTAAMTKEMNACVNNCRTDKPMCSLYIINDDHLFSDSVTPSKVKSDKNSSLINIENKYGSFNYDIPFIDDELFFVDDWYIAEDGKWISLLFC